MSDLGFEGDYFDGLILYGGGALAFHAENTSLENEARAINDLDFRAKDKPTFNKFLHADPDKFVHNACINRKDGSKILHGYHKIKDNKHIKMSVYYNPKENSKRDTKKIANINTLTLRELKIDKTRNDGGVYSKLKQYQRPSDPIIYQVRKNHRKGENDKKDIELIHKLEKEITLKHIDFLNHMDFLNQIVNTRTKDLF